MENWAEIRRLHRIEGLSQRAIARRLGIARDTVAAAMLDRLVHHAEILSLKGDSYRLKDKRLGPTPEPRPTPA